MRPQVKIKQQILEEIRVTRNVKSDKLESLTGRLGSGLSRDSS